MKKILDDHKVRLSPEWTNLHWTTKAGPHGPALWTCLRDLVSLPETLKQDIFLLGGNNLRLKMESLMRVPLKTYSALQLYFDPKGVLKPFRKLSVVKDKEAKRRIIAIFDYWSQSALKPLHDQLFSCLRKFQSDRTFNQTDVSSILNCPGPYYRFDLTRATDRFPLSFQIEVLSLLIGQDKAIAWARILTHYEFTPNWKPSPVVKYGAGQPIGAYSRWAMFTLSHHLVVQYAAWRVNKYPFSRYLLLGDDIVIAGSDVALSYKEVITELGVSISEAKTHVSQDTFEFAKKWVHRGTKITPFPTGSLLESAGSFTLLAETLREAVRVGLVPYHKGYITNLWNPGLCESLFEALGKHRAFARKLAYKLQTILIFPTNDDVGRSRVKLFFEHINVRVPCGWRYATALNYFNRVAASSLALKIKKDSESLVSQQHKWHKSLKSLLQDFPGLESQFAPDLSLLDLPQFHAMEEKLHAMSWKMIEFTILKARDLNTFVYRKPFLEAPDMDRLNPRRASHRILGNQSAFVQRLSTLWKQWDKAVHR